MVEYKHQQREITIKIDGDYSELVSIQNALIDLMRSYNFKDFGNGADATFFYALNLLQATLPDDEQQKRGFTTDGRQIMLPENLTHNQELKIDEALRILGNDPASNNTNPIFQALKKVG